MKEIFLALHSSWQRSIELKHEEEKKNLNESHLANRHTSISVYTEE